MRLYQSGPVSNVNEEVFPIFLRAPELETYHRMQFSVIPETLLWDTLTFTPEGDAVRIS